MTNYFPTASIAKRLAAKKTGQMDSSEIASGNERSDNYESPPQFHSELEDPEALQMIDKLIPYVQSRFGDDMVEQLQFMKNTINEVNEMDQGDEPLPPLPGGEPYSGDDDLPPDQPIRQP